MKLTTVDELLDHIRAELLGRPTFDPIRCDVVVPSTSYRYTAEGFPSTSAYLRACGELMEHGGYIRIDGADESSLFVEVEK